MTNSRPGSRVSDWIEWGLLVIGVALMAWCATVMVRADHYQHQQRTALNRAHAAPLPPPIKKARLARGTLIGSLDIPRLRLSVMAIEGDEDKWLERGIGHLPDTPLPWEKGNSAFAGHRDTFLRAMKDISAGDQIRLTTPHGTFTYRVREIAIVTPDNVSGLSATDDSTLTLITCYPFSYVGNAPKRFVVRAWPTERQPARSTKPDPRPKTP